MKNNLIRVALIGPESTGKSTLAKQLAKKFDTVWVPEYSREYVQHLKRKYTKEDILICARKQLLNELDAHRVAEKVLFVDTELINCSVWLKDAFDETDPWIEENIYEYRYDHYLLLFPDIPFVHDPVRENGNRREYFFEWYKRELEKRSFSYTIINGNFEKRMRTAVGVVEQLILQFANE